MGLGIDMLCHPLGILLDVQAENFAFVQGFIDLRDYGLDKGGEQMIFEEVLNAAKVQSLDAEVYQVFVESAVGTIDSSDLGRAGFHIVIDVLSQYNEGDGSDEYSNS